MDDVEDAGNDNKEFGSSPSCTERKKTRIKRSEESKAEEILSAVVGNTQKGQTEEGLIAHDRSGNERGVNVCKSSGLFQRGFHPGMCPKRFQNVWRAWAFRTNFIYKPVL